MKKLLLTFAAASSLAACGTACQPGPVSPVVHTDTQVVEKAVPVLCVDKLPQPRLPLSSSKAILAGSGYQVVMKYDRELQVRDSYESDLVAAITGCLKAPVRPQSGSPGGSGTKK